VNPGLALSTANFVISGGQTSELPWHGPPGTGFRPWRFVVEHGHHPEEAGIAPNKQPYRLRVAPDMSMKRVDADLLREITVRSETGQVVSLDLLGHPVYDTGACYALDRRRRDGRLRIRRPRFEHRCVELRKGGTAENLDPAERIEWTGQCQLMAAGQQRLKWIARRQRRDHEACCSAHTRRIGNERASHTRGYPRSLFALAFASAAACAEDRNTD